MYIILTFLWCTTLAFAPAVLAQQMYKTVGADGKVTFSDRPQIDDKAKLSVMKSYTLRAVEPPKPRERATGKLKGVRSELPVAITPDIEEAIVTIMGLSSFSGQFEIFCNGDENDTRAFSAATLGWRQRNVAPVEHQKRLLMLVLSPTKRAELIAREETLLAEEIAKVAAKSPAARKEWCQGVITELNSGRNDIVNPALMAVPVTPYRAR